MEATGHTGLVVYADCSQLWNYRVYIVDLNTLIDTGMPLVRRIDDSAFHLSPEASRNKEDEWLKSEERKANRPVQFGDAIIWSMNTDMDNRLTENVIVRFKKVSSKNLQYFPVRCHNGGCQVRLDGVINPEDPGHLFTQYFPYVYIPVEKQNYALSNIFLQAWVTLKLNIQTGRLMIEFDNFENICDRDIQMDIGSAPWNTGKDKYCIVTKYASDSEDEDYGGHSQESQEDGGPKLEVYGVEAVRTGDRSVLIWALPDYKAVLPFHDAKFTMNPGVCYSVDAMWNQFEEMYMINHVSASRSSLAVPAIDSGLLLVPVKEHETIRGLFENETLGPIDDPKGILGFLHLSPLAKTAIPVVVSDGFPSRGGQFRFQIEDIHGNNKEKLSKWFETAEVKLEGVSGVVIGDGDAFSAAHSPIFFKFSNIDDPPPIGTFVKFSAIYDKEAKIFRITKWSRDASKEPLKLVIRRMDPKHPDKKQPVFFVSGKAPAHMKIKEMILTSEFGLIDDNLKMLQFDPKNPRKQFYAWVTFANYSPEDPFFCRTVFQVVGARPEDPEERVKVRQVLSEEEIRFQELFASFVEESMDAFNDERGQAAGEISSERFTTLAASPFSTQSVALSMCSSAPPISTVTAYIGLFASEARAIYSASPCSVRPESSASQNMLNTENGYDLDGARIWDGSLQRCNRKSEPYTGPVLMPPGSTMKFDILETLKRVRFTFGHGNCGLNCELDCSWLRVIAELVVKGDGFFDEVTEHYPHIAEEISNAFP